MPYSDCDNFGDQAILSGQAVIGGNARPDFAEHRKCRRIAWHADAMVAELPSDGLFPSVSLAGKVLDIGTGGVCMVVGMPIPTGTVLRCAIKVPGVEIALPTVMQVAWVAMADEQRFVLGMRHVL